ncbi:MAG TPA: hypothetical protein VER58_03785 [Thermoanaerobaculia bacterium]|nr:hypothetical protein [Thermoanaerobaculia bacterium]
MKSSRTTLRFVCLLLLLTTGGSVQLLNATTYVVPSDRVLVRQASAIVVGSALSSRTELNDNGGIETVTTISLEETLKGTLDSDTFDLYEPGGLHEDRMMVIPGVPRFQDGERYILFLMKNAGKWRVLDLGLGKFRFTTDRLGHDVAVRDFHDVFTLEVDGSKHREANREATPFIEFIRLAGRGAPAQENYAIPAESLMGTIPPPPEIRSQALRPAPLAITNGEWYTSSFDGMEGGAGSRWCGTIVAGNCLSAFPSAVHFKSIGSETGAGGSPPGADAINSAFSAWNGAPGAVISYAYDGNDVSGTTNTPNTIPGDGKNTIAFEYDLSGQGIFAYSCMSGGVLGLGGDIASGTHIGPNSDTFFTAVEGDVWMNQGIAGCSALFSSGNFTSAVTHEVGHTLGFRHSNQNRLGGTPCSGDVNLECSSSAIMTAVVTNGLSGALQTWDQHAAAAVYPAPAAPAAPTGVVATATSTTTIQVSWSGLCVTTCHIYRSADHVTYSNIGSSVTSPFSDALGSSTPVAYLYKVRAFNGTTESADSNVDQGNNVIFTNDPLVVQTTPITATHLTELRNVTNALRTLAGLGGASFTDPSPSGVVIKAVHITEIRTNLDAAMSVLGLTTGGYTDGSLAGVVVKAVHFQEIRNRVK